MVKKVTKILGIYLNGRIVGEIQLSFSTDQREPDVNAKVFVKGLVDTVYEGSVFFSDH